MQRLRRVIVVGPPGSGKTTVARALADKLELPHVELDGLFWRPGWRQATVDELRGALAAAIAGERWVIDGNYYTATSPVSWSRAETIVWLDLPRWHTVSRVAMRTVAQILRRRELWPGTRQTPRRGVALLRFAWREHGKYRARYGPLSVADGGPRWVRLRSPTAIREWTASLERGRDSAPCEHPGSLP